MSVFYATSAYKARLKQYMTNYSTSFYMTVYLLACCPKPSSSKTILRNNRAWYKSIFSSLWQPTYKQFHTYVSRFLYYIHVLTDAIIYLLYNISHGPLLSRCMLYVDPCRERSIGAILHCNHSKSTYLQCQITGICINCSSVLHSHWRTPGQSCASGFDDYLSIDSVAVYQEMVLQWGGG